MFGNKKLTLTATTCRVLEEIRLALEVWHGVQIRFKHLEFDRDMISGHGAYIVGEREAPLVMTSACDGTTWSYMLKIDNEWYTARFDSPSQVRVISQTLTTDSDFMWKVGTSALNRWEEPLYPPPLSER